MDIEEVSRREEEQPIVRKSKSNKGKDKGKDKAHHVFAPPENYSQMMEQYKQEDNYHDHQQMKPAGLKRGLAIFDFVVRLIAAVVALAAAAKMGTAEQTLPFFTQFLQFHAEYNDLPSFVFFMIANAIVGGYLVLSLPFSIVCIIRPLAVAPRLFLIIFDTAMMVLNASAAAAAAAIVYLAHQGNASANWLPVCQQFGDFCQGTSGAVVASFIAAVLLMFLIIFSAISLKNSN